MIPGEGKTTPELFREAGNLLKKLERLMTGRKQRDKACMTLTDMHVNLEALARRLQQIEFTGAPVAQDDEEERETDDGRASALAMHELLDLPADDLEDEESVKQGVSVRELRLRYFRAFLDYQVAGCRSFEEVVLKGISLVRRIRPEMLKHFAISKSDVGRMVGRSRANVHSFEQRMIEKPLKAQGVKGFHGLGGQRSEKHREKCRKAQKGNTNRRTGEKKRRDAA